MDTLVVEAETKSERKKNKNPTICSTVMRLSNKINDASIVSRRRKHFISSALVAPKTSIILSVNDIEK